MTTVARKAIPKVRPLSLRSCLFMGILAESLGYDFRSSDVISTIIALMASQRLISDNVNGNCICYLSVYDFEGCFQIDAVG